MVPICTFRLSEEMRFFACCIHYLSVVVACMIITVPLWSPHCYSKNSHSGMKVYHYEGVLLLMDGHFLASGKSPGCMFANEKRKIMLRIFTKRKFKKLFKIFFSYFFSILMSLFLRGEKI